MTEKSNNKYKKPKMICPFGQARQENGNFRAFSTNGMSMHVRQIHPEKYDEYQTHRDKYIAKFACDDDGILIGKEPEPVPEPVIEQEVISEPEYVEFEEPPEPPKPPVPDNQPTYIPPPPPAVKKPKPKPKPKPVKEPQTEEFPDDKKRDRYEYNPYGF